MRQTADSTGMVQLEKIPYPMSDIHENPPRDTLAADPGNGGGDGITTTVVVELDMTALAEKLFVAHVLPSGSPGPGHIRSDDETKAWLLLLGRDLHSAIAGRQWSEIPETVRSSFLRILKEELTSAFGDPLAISFTVYFAERSSLNQSFPLRWIVLLPNGALTILERNEGRGTLTVVSTYFRRESSSYLNLNQIRFRAALMLIHRYCDSQQPVKVPKANDPFRLSIARHSETSIDSHHGGETHYGVTFWNRETWGFSRKGLWKMDVFRDRNTGGEQGNDGGHNIRRQKRNSTAAPGRVH